jgi:3-phosphoshikimate 1-carboxyvinyltransferase
MPDRFRSNERQAFRALSDFPMIQTITPVERIEGALELPGDKSISHRYAMIAAIAKGESRLASYSSGADCQSTLAAMEALGARVTRENGEIIIAGAGLDGLREPAADLDAGNSGSTIRMLSGILAAQPFATRIGGDESLSRRPMDRVIRPLTAMGARIEARDGRFPPLLIHGSRLHPIEYELPVASAQVKSCVLLAGLFCDGETVVHEPTRTRDHTERALAEFGADIRAGRNAIRLQGRPKLTGRRLRVPGDISSAAFFLAAALMVPEAELVISGLGLNPTRAALLDYLLSIGAKVRVLHVQEVNGELIGEIGVSTSRITGGPMDPVLVPALIDEIPVLTVLGASTAEGFEVRGARELRVKETDRIATVGENLRRMGLEVEVFDDGLRVPGGQRFRAAEFDSFGDHRIAMAFAIAALRADGPSKIHNAEAASVSFPEFYRLLETLTGQEASAPKS